MSTPNLARPDAPRDEAGIRNRGGFPPTGGPALQDPRSISAMDNIGVDDQADLLDVELDGEPGDLDASGRSFSDDVRSDGNDDERHERR